MSLFLVTSLDIQYIVLSYLLEEFDMKTIKLKTVITLSLVFLSFSCIPILQATFTPPINWPTINISIDRI